MRIGIISDIHSNIEALDEVLMVMARLKIDRYVCLGDLVGYGANPSEVMDIVRPLVDFTIMGNHDAAVAGQMDYQYYYDEARDALAWTRESLSEENIEYLKSLPYFRIEEEICFVHGEPIAPERFNYVYTLEQATALSQHYELLRNVTFVGHSHLRRVYEMSDREAVELPVDNFTMRADRKYVIAIGSVGQPRDYDPRAGFVVYDSGARHVEFYRIEYNVEGAADKIIKAGLPEYFATRLYSGS